MSNGRGTPRKLVYLELVVPSLDTPRSRDQALYWPNRDFPWARPEGWAVEWWGIRSRTEVVTSWDGLRTRGLKLPFARVPWAVLAPTAWATHLVLTLFRSKNAVIVARHAYLGAGAAAGRLFRRRRSPLVVGIVARLASSALRVYRSGFLFRLIDLVDRFVLRRAGLVVVLGRFSHDLAHRAGVPEERIIEVPHPVKWGDIGAAEGIEKDPRRTACAARLIALKGVDVLLESFAIVLQRVPDAVLDIAGEGPVRPALEQHARRLGIEDRVNFLGWVQTHEMPRLLGRALVAVLPSRAEEGHPMILHEAALAGCALIGTDLGGIRDIVVPGVTGTIVPPENPQALADALLDCLADPDGARAIGKEARAATIGYYERRGPAIDSLRDRVEDLIAGPSSGN